MSHNENKAKLSRQAAEELRVLRRGYLSCSFKKDTKNEN